MSHMMGKQPPPWQYGKVSQIEVTGFWMTLVGGHQGPKLFPTARMYLDMSRSMRVLAQSDAKTSDTVWEVERDNLFRDPSSVKMRIVKPPVSSF